MCRLTAVGTHSAPWEVFSNMVQPTHTQATRGESNTLSFPSIPAAEFELHLGTHLLLVTTDVCGVRVWPREKMPLLQTGILEGLQGSNKRPGLSVEHHCLYCNITEAWQVPLSGPSPNENIQQLSYSSLSPRKSMQKLMVWDVSYSGVASPQSCFAELEGSLSEGFNSASE